MLAHLSAVKEFILCYSPQFSLHMQGNTLKDFCLNGSEEQPLVS